jgi:hypothetical protein
VLEQILSRASRTAGYERFEQHGHSRAFFAIVITFWDFWEVIIYTAVYGGLSIFVVQVRTFAHSTFVFVAGILFVYCVCMCHCQVLSCCFFLSLRSCLIVFNLLYCFRVVFCGVFVFVLELSV